MKHYNPSINERINRVFNTKAGDQGEQEIGLIGTIPVTPVCNIIKSVSSITTIYTTPADKDFYLTSCTLTMAKAAGDTATSIVIQAAVGGVTTVLVRLSGITLTAERDSLFCPFPVPIKIDRGSAIALAGGGTFTSVGGSIQGYTEEVTK